MKAYSSTPIYSGRLFFFPFFCKYFVLLIFIISCLFSISCNSKHEDNTEAGTSVINEWDDRLIGIVQIDTLTRYIRLISDLENFNITIQKKGNDLHITTDYLHKDMFYLNILGQQLSGDRMSIYERTKESKFFNKWKPIDLKEKNIYGFEASVFEKDKNYVYIPYEILVTINQKRKLN